jgi:hypothetical protein
MKSMSFDALVEFAVKLAQLKYSQSMEHASMVNGISGRHGANAVKHVMEHDSVIVYALRQLPNVMELFVRSCPIPISTLSLLATTQTYWKKLKMKNVAYYVSLFDYDSIVKYSNMKLGFTTTTTVSPITTMPHEECYVSNGTDIIALQVNSREDVDLLNANAAHEFYSPRQ